MALSRHLGVQSVIDDETKFYLNKVFTEKSIKLKTFSEAFCDDAQEMPFESYRGEGDDILLNKYIRKGKLLNLWPEGLETW